MIAGAALDTARPSGIDFRRPFMPECFSPLRYTVVYESLTEAERLRYNQLHALYVNEQIMFFEVTLAKNVLSPLAAGAVPADLAADLRRFIDEEIAHTAMFRALNRSCAPHLYRTRDFHFIRVPAPLLATFVWAARRPLTFPLFLWLMLLQEEKSSAYAREMLRDAEEREPRFVQVHRQHLADEVDHVRWDERLLDLLWDRKSPRLRRWNARALAWLLREFFLVPKRGGWRVIEEWAREFPRWQPRLPEIRGQFAALRDDGAFRAATYSRELAPRTFARFERYPEFHALLRFLGAGELPKAAAP